MQQTLPHSAFVAVPRSRSLRSTSVPRRFSRRLFGADPAEVNQALAATEEAVSDLVGALEHERTVLEGRLERAAAESEALRVELTAAAERAARYREQESMIAGALVTAQRAAEELQRTAQAEADEIVGKAEAIASDIVQASCRSASEILQKAQQDADGIMEAARERAGAFVALLRTEADHLVLNAQETFWEAQREVEQRAASLMARVNAGLADEAAGLPAGAHEEAQLLPTGSGAEESATGPAREAAAPGAGVADAAPSDDAAEAGFGEPPAGVAIRFLDGAVAFAVTGGAMSLVYLLRRIFADFRA